MKILAIGNSFSDDAMRYLSKLAHSQGDTMKCVNLMIGSCTLKQHYLNILDDECKYHFMFNGEGTGIYVSIREALKSDDWDVVTLQQASHCSTDFESYIPYITQLKDYIKRYSPKSKIYLHQTWSYENGSPKLSAMGYETSAQMFTDVENAYQKAAATICADGLIPSGRAMQLLSETDRVHRDTFHATLGIGRFMLSLVWYMTLTGKSICGDFSTFPFDEPVRPDELERATAAVAHTLQEVNKNG